MRATGVWQVHVSTLSDIPACQQGRDTSVPTGIRILIILLNRFITPWLLFFPKLLLFLYLYSQIPLLPGKSFQEWTFGFYGFDDE